MEVEKEHVEGIEDRMRTQDNRTDYRSLLHGPWRLKGSLYNPLLTRQWKDLVNFLEH